MNIVFLAGGNLSNYCRAVLMKQSTIVWGVLGKKVYVKNWEEEVGQTNNLV